MSWLDSYFISEFGKAKGSSVKYRCECGAEKTNNKNLHAEWCPRYEKDKFYTDSSRRKGNEITQDKKEK